MPDDGKPNLVRRYFGSYKSADRGMIETLLSDDFIFTSPYDDQIGRVAYVERCWPAAGTFVYHEIAGQRLIVHDHASEPFDPESGRARLDLTPDGQPGSAAIS